MTNFFRENILTRAFWGDEAWTALISALPIPDLILTTAADFHPPLYYLIIHFWIYIFGNSEFALRSVSLIFWGLSGLMAFFLAKTMQISKINCFYVMFYTLFNPFIFPYAFEARNYTLFMFFSIMAVYFFINLTQSDKPYSRKTQLGYVLSTLAGVYTHYFMFFLLMSQIVYILIFLRNKIKQFFILYVLIFCGYLPWLPLFYSQAKTVAGGYWIAPPTWETIRDTAKVLIRGEQKSIFYDYLFQIYLFFSGICIYVGFQTRKIFSKEVFILSSWIVFSFGIPLLISFYRPIFFYRYLVTLSVPLAILPLYLLSTKSQRPSYMKTFLPLICMIIFLYTNYLSFTTKTSQIFKPVLAKIHQQGTQSQIIFTYLPSFAEVVYYNNYDNAPMPVSVIPEGLQQASGKALLDTYERLQLITIAKLPNHGQFWIVEPGQKYRFVSK